MFKQAVAPLFKYLLAAIIFITISAAALVLLFGVVSWFSSGAEVFSRHVWQMPSVVREWLPITMGVLVVLVAVAVVFNDPRK